MDAARGAIGRRGLAALAGLAGVIGLAASAITAQLFTVGMERLNDDAQTRQALVAAGILMIVTELVAFGVAAVLPRQVLKGLRLQLLVFGALLFGFEGLTIYATQAATMHAAAVVSTANETQITVLSASIGSQHQLAQDFRAAGLLQSASTNAWTRQLGATALKQALDVEQGLLPLARELSGLQARDKPRLDAIFGATGTLAYVVARSVLISLMGLVMFGAAGALLRASREAEPGIRAELQEAVYSSATEQDPEQMLVQVQRPERLEVQLQVRVQDAPVDVPSDFERIKLAVLAGTLKPSVRGIRETFGGSTATVLTALHALEAAGVTQRRGQGWVVFKG